MQELRSHPRFPTVAPSAGHYESYYLKLADPRRPVAVWIRHTVHKRPGEAPVGSVWFTLFDAEASGPVASKETLPAGELGSRADEYIHVGESRLVPGRAVGAASSDRCRAAWDLAFADGEEPFLHLPERMYRTAIPRTKALSMHPLTEFSGEVLVDGRRIEVDGWPGMIGHNWGSQHAERWVWLHGTGFEEQPGAWFDAALGRIRLGPVTVPWIGNGCLTLDGVRHRLGGPARIRSTRVLAEPGRCEVVMGGEGVTVRMTAAAEHRRFVGWLYSDPDGPGHHTINCSIADMTLDVARPRQPDVRLSVAGGAVYELGMRETDHGIPLQPFSDP